MSLINQLRFDQEGLIPAITRDAEGEVLMMAFMNAEAVEKTLESGMLHYYSRSRQRLWMKGKNSGHVQLLREIRLDCDADCLLITVDQQGPACQTGQRTCFSRVWRGEKAEVEEDSIPVPEAGPGPKDVLEELFQVIRERRQSADGEKSYVKSLFDKGLDKILGKIGEEATETAVAGKGGDPDQVICETADLFFHTLVLLGYYDIPPERIYGELRRRFGISGIAEKKSRKK